MEAYLDALGDLIDARLEYAQADPEWKSRRWVSAAEERLELALRALLADPAAP